MNLFPAATPARIAVLALLGALAGCSTIEGLFSGDKVDYRGGSTPRSQALEVPPDLTQLARESRYQPQGGVINASAAGTAPVGGAAGASALPGVAPTSQGPVKVERAGQQRWLVVQQTPEQVWPLLKNFWQERGFTMTEENAQTGVMETNWSENRAKLPADAVRNTIGTLLRNLYDTGERDRYRTRVERTAAGTEIYVSHRGAEEIYTSERRDSTTWRARPTDPQLEAEMLSRMMLALGPKEEPARAAAAVAAAPEAAPRARAEPVATGATSLVVDEPFDRAWRRVGVALDRSGFTVEDRDRAAGLYYVRYVDPKSVGQDEPGWWSKLFGSSANPQAAQRYRIAVKGGGDKTTVSVQNSTGATDGGDNAKRIVAVLVTELR